MSRSAGKGRTRSVERFARRRRRLVRKFRGAGVDALLVTGPENVRYLSGFTGEDSALLVTRGEVALLTDARYTTQAADEVRDIGVLCRRKAMMPFAAGVAGRFGARRLGIESASLTVAELEALRKAAGPVEVAETSGWVEALRLRKDASEVARIEEAVRLAEAAFLQVRPLVRPGATERSLAAELEGAMLRLGADAAAFRPIVLAEERAALPHGRPSERRLRDGEAVLFDWGARRDLYVSDLTRVLFVNRMAPHHRRVYGAVLEAQVAALKAIRPQQRLGDVDRAARRSLKRHRRAKYFSHAVGHGLGMEVHEAPTVHGRNDAPVQAGMVFTVEPGVYYPGRIGVRIEDMVLVGRRGCRILSRLPKKPQDVIVRTC